MRPFARCAECRDTSGARDGSPTREERHPEIARTRKALETLHAAVDAWRASQPNECPSVAQLKDDKALALSFEDRDAWGMPYEVRCDEDTSFVVSRGPDKRDGTTDDLSFP